ncbi:MAG: serine/threonine protein kinase [Nannocystaceae bacterium]|nr:serine/threonine protein kinase [Nannocystaceae bacterium]
MSGVSPEDPAITVDADAPEPTAAAGREPSRERYELGEEIARGGSGRISRAHDHRLDREVAVKQLLQRSAALELRLAREARVTARLQHPAIVPIYDVGRGPDGQPYYAMKLVRGRTLAQAIDAARSLPERVALFPDVLAVAEAVAYAHARGVIHRDLKPGNVVLGGFGETVVIDWGLAKAIDGEPDGTTTDPIGRIDTADDGLHTEAGTVLGTPSYMAPEQARGEPLDRRADVYALGAMLYHVLAGRPPYARRAGRSVVADVVAGPPAALQRVVPEAPPDLIAIVDKAMAREPALRYRDAGELAADLRRFQTGQLVGARRYGTLAHVGRFVRRHAAAVAVAAVLGVVMLVGGVLAVLAVIDQRNRADEQRERAEQARAVAVAERDAAQELATFMLDDLRLRLEPIGRLELLSGVGARVLDYYGSLEHAGLAIGDREARRRAQADELVGETTLEGGAIAEALAMLQQARTAADATGDLGLSARASERIASIHRRRGERDRAESEYARAVVDAEDAGELLTESRARLGLAGVLADSGRGERARDAAEHAVAVARELAWLEPTQSSLELGNALSELAGVLAIARSGDAGPVLAEARALLLSAIDDAPDDVRRLAVLARIDERMVRFDLRRLDAAEIADEACALTRRLRATEPRNAGWVRAHIAALEVYAAVRGIAGDHAAALAAFREAAAAAELGAQLEPENRDAHRVVAYMHNRIGDAQFEIGDVDAALVSYLTARDLARAIGARWPSVHGRGMELPMYADVAQAFERLGRAHEARGAWRDGVVLGEALLREADAPAVREDLGRAHVGLAAIALDEPALAREHARRALALLSALPNASAGGRAARSQAQALLARLGADPADR